MSLTAIQTSHDVPERTCIFYFRFAEKFVSLYGECSTLALCLRLNDLHEVHLWMQHRSNGHRKKPDRALPMGLGPFMSLMFEVCFPDL